jgi:D-inositol-3-phosphate glycosyltransferase
LLLYVGRIQPTKGADIAVEAFGEVAVRLAAARLLVVGGPSGRRGESELDRLRSKVSELGLAASVRFMGPVPHGLVADLYRAADLVLAPSRSETFGLVAAEAQACGTPVVAARIGGLTYVVKDGETGILIDGWDPVDYAEAALRVLLAPGLAEEMGRAGVAWARAFSWDATARRFLELYGGMLKGG